MFSIHGECFFVAFQRVSALNSPFRINCHANAPPTLYVQLQLSLLICLVDYLFSPFKTYSLFCLFNFSFQDMAELVTSFYLPTTNFSAGQIFKSWDYWDESVFQRLTISVNLKAWTPKSKVYLVATAYRLNRRALECDGVR